MCRRTSRCRPGAGKIRSESAAALRHWWGVGGPLVWKGRRTLDLQRSATAVVEAHQSAAATEEACGPKAGTREGQGWRTG
jgi:hypothetical protein